MNLATIAASIPSRSEGGQLCRCYVEFRGGGFGVVFGRDAGRVHEPVGPVFPKPKTAVELADLLNGRLAA